MHIMLKRLLILSMKPTVKLNYEEKDKNVEFLKDNLLLKNYANNIIAKEITWKSLFF